MTRRPPPPLPPPPPPPRLTDAEREFYRWLIREELKKWVA